MGAEAVSRFPQRVKSGSIFHTLPAVLSLTVA